MRTGTGKTFVGALLCERIVSHTQETILCVCYTNHALDSFLEELLARGMKDIIRIGGRSKSAQLEPYNLRTMARNSRSRSSTSEFRRMDVLREEDSALRIKVRTRLLASIHCSACCDITEDSIQWKGGLHREQ